MVEDEDGDEKAQGGETLESAMKKLQGGELETLDLQMMQPDASELKGMIGLLREDKNLSAINLRWIGLDASSCGRVASGLWGHERLTTLDLSNNVIKSHGAMAVLEAASNMLALTSLNLSDNNIGGDNKRSLFAGLGSCRALKTLLLSSNNINDDDASSLGTDLAQNQSLTSLHLAQNEIGDDGAVRLARALKGSPAMRELNLMENFVGDVGAMALSEAAGACSSLTSLNLSGNDFGGESREALMGCRSATLTTVHAEECAPVVFDTNGPAGGQRGV
mmetsp:Transcript_48643/g.118077  ORF Transcript_48643/g.118077 Transcript_48643/m.118077 type:complete len:277 (-) Transcript_48643:62-892(-)